MYGKATFHDNTSWRHNPKDINLKLHRRENLKSRGIKIEKKRREKYLDLRGSR